MPWYEISKSGARKLHLNIDELPLKSKLWWKLLVVGDILGKGSQTTLPVSKNRKIEFSKWSRDGTCVDLPEIKLENWEKDLAKFSLSDYDKGAEMIRSFKEVGKQQENFLSTNTTFKEARENRGGKQKFPTTATSQKELGYYGTRIIKPLKVFAPQYVEKLSSIGGSRESCYYSVGYLDPITQQIGRFLVDKG